MIGSSSFKQFLFNNKFDLFVHDNNGSKYAKIFTISNYKEFKYPCKISAAA